MFGGGDNDKTPGLAKSRPPQRPWLVMALHFQGPWQLGAMIGQLPSLQFKFMRLKIEGAT